MSEDIEFCLHSECKNRKCERHPANIHCWWFDHSFMDLKDTEFCKQQMAKKGTTHERRRNTAGT